MPPKNDPHHQAQRRERKDILQEDLVTAIEQLDTNASASSKDDTILPCLQQALDAEVDPNLIVMNNTFTLLNFFAWHRMMRCFEECLLQKADPTMSNSTNKTHNALYCCLAGPSSTPDSAMRMVRLLLNHPKAKKLGNDDSFFEAINKDFGTVLEKMLRQLRPERADMILLNAVCLGNFKLSKIS